MKQKMASERVGGFLFLLVMVASAATMLWLFWHFPIITAVTTLILLAGLAVAARLAKSLEQEANADLDQRENSV